MILFLLVATTLYVATATEYSPEVLSVNVAPLQVATALHELVDNRDVLRVLVAGTLGTSDATKLKLFYGADAEHLTQCTELALVAPNELACKSLAAGAGKRLLVLERVAADSSDVVEARHRFEWSYMTPEVLALTGGQDGLPLLVFGLNFGPADSSAPDSASLGKHKVEVFVGPYAAHSAESPCVVVDSKQIRCASVPEGFGTQLFVTVCIDGGCGKSTKPLFDYKQPIVEQMSIAENKLHLIGSGFGPALNAEKLSDVAVHPPLLIEINGKHCANPQVIESGRHVACDAVAVPDAESADVVLHRHGAQMTTRLLTKRAAFNADAFSPNNGPTTGGFRFTVTGSDLGAVGTIWTVRIGGRPARNCVTTIADSQIVCAAAPAGFGINQDVSIEREGVMPVIAPTDKFSYDAPTISYLSRPSTRGGKLFVNGANFGPSFAPVRVVLFSGSDERDCKIERNTHNRIQCHAPHGSGDNHNVRVIVGSGANAQQSAQVRAFGYQRPDIHATTRPHWAGGHLYIRGHNFGAHDDKITVYIDHEECKYATLVKKHEEIRCRAKPGPADGKEYTVKVRVDGQSSDKEGHSYHHMQFGNNAPSFDAHSTQYVAVAGEKLIIKLPAHDKDGDEIFFRSRSLPHGAVWHQGFGFMQIEYDVPAGLLEYPHHETNVTVEASVTDGPGTTSTLLHISVRACPSNMDTCKDLSCVPRNTMCPTCPMSNVVRCGASRPILEPESGKCHSMHDLQLSLARVAHAPVASFGVTIDLAQGDMQHVALFSRNHSIVGVMEFHGARSFRTDTGPQPSGAHLVCVEVAACDANAGSAPLVSHAVKIGLGSEANGGFYLGLPIDGAGIGPLAADGYGHCLARFDEAHGEWHCVDESLTLRSNMLAGNVKADGCYAIMRDNCADVANPDQRDSDGNGEGDLCSGGGTLCEDCHSWDALNVKFLKKFAPTPEDNEQDTCAKNQSPIVIVTEEGDRYYSADFVPDEEPEPEYRVL